MAEFKVGDRVRIIEDQSAAPVGSIVVVDYVDEKDKYIEYRAIVDGTSCDTWGADFSAIELVDLNSPEIAGEPAKDEDDPVNHPSHYTFGKYEVLAVIEDWGLSYHLGNAIKYIARAGRKDPAKEKQDLEKAVFYLQRRIANLG